MSHAQRLKTSTYVSKEMKTTTTSSIAWGTEINLVQSDTKSQLVQESLDFKEVVEMSFNFP